MNKSTVIKIKALNFVLVAYVIIFILRALYWFHDRNAAILWFIDTPFDFIVLGIAFIIRTNLLKTSKLRKQQVNPYALPKSYSNEKAADIAAKGITIALTAFVLLGILAMIMFAVFTSIH